MRPRKKEEAGLGIILGAGGTAEQPWRAFRLLPIHKASWRKGQGLSFHSWEDNPAWTLQASAGSRTSVQPFNPRKELGEEGAEAMDIGELDCSPTLKFPLQAHDPLPRAKWWRFEQKSGRQHGKGTLRKEEEGGGKRVFRVLRWPRAGHLESVGSTVLASPPLSPVPKAGSASLGCLPRDASLLRFSDSDPVSGPVPNTLVSTSQPTPGLLGVPYLPSPARSCMVWVRVATGEEVAERSGDPRRP